MSKKHKRQKQKQKFPWIFLALGGVLVVLAIFLFARQVGDGGGTPSIAVDQQKIDYGDVKFGVNKTFAVKVTNTGAMALCVSKKNRISKYWRDADRLNWPSVRWY